MNDNWGIEIISNSGDTISFSVKHEESLLSFQEVFQNWRDSAEFVSFYTDALISFGFEELYWEHPAIKTTYIHQPYEAIVGKSQLFKNRKPNAEAFKDYIYTDHWLAIFPNIGKNATLVIPTQHGPPDSYKQLGSFIRKAPNKQVIELFMGLGNTIIEEVEAGKLVWLNTAGLGVIWLHIRLDSRPKYYKTLQFKEPDFLGSKGND